MEVPHRSVVGRGRELAALSDALASVGNGPVGCVIHGVAGVGKTTVWLTCLRLAEEWGYRVLSVRSVC